MTIKNLTLAVALVGTTAVAGHANTISFSATDLTGGTRGGDQDSVTVSKSGLTLTATAAEVAGNDGAIDIFAGGGGGLYIGAVRSGSATDANNPDFPTDGRYTLGFDRAITGLTFTIDWLTHTSNAGSEILSEFATNLGALDLTAMNYSGSNTTLDAALDQITSSSNRGTGTFSMTGTPFNALSFRHTQGSQNIGFTIRSVSVDLAPVPLPAGLPLLLAGLGAFAWVRRRAS